MYQAFGLLRPDSDFTLEAAAKKLMAKLPTYKVEHTGDRIAVSTDDWGIELVLNSAPSVAEESREMAVHIAGSEADGKEIASCDRRVEVSSDVPDPEMEHFNDYLFVVEVLQSFKGVIAVDPQEPSLL